MAPVESHAGPAIWAIRLWPSAARWRTASPMPRTSSLRTAGARPNSSVRFISTIGARVSGRSVRTGSPKVAEAMISPSTCRSVMLARIRRCRSGSLAELATIVM